MTALTSILAFQETVSERSKQASYLLSLYRAKGAMSDREASYLLGWERAAVSARRNDLLKQGLVVEMGKKKDRDTGKLVSFWAAVGDGRLGI